MVDPETIKEIQKLSKQGESLSSIAKQFGVSWLTARKYAAGEENSGQDESRLFHRKHHSSIPQRKVIPVERPSRKVIDQREDVEIVGLEVEKQKSLKELEKVTPQREHPLVVERKAKFEAKKLDLDEFKVDRELQALREEERKKAEVEEEDRFEREIERAVLAEEQEKARKHFKWVEGWKEWALTWGVPRGVSIPADVKFKVKDGVGKVLIDRSEHESKWDIEELVKITTQSVLQPYLDKVKVEKKTRLIQLYALPKIEDYIRDQRLEAYVDEESKGKIREYVRNHFMKVLVGNEVIISSSQVTDFLDTFFKPIREKIRDAQEKERREKERERMEKMRQEREAREAKEKAFWEKLKEENEEERIEGLLQIGLTRFNSYLITNRKELGSIDAKEKEEARRYLEGELKEEIEGNETDEEVRKIVDEILTDFFF